MRPRPANYPTRTATEREEAAREIARVLGENLPLFARVHNTLAKEKDIEDRWRGMPTPQTGRHLANQVEPEVVEALRNAVVAAYPKLSHRYYALKAKWMGLDTLQIWDRNAPLPMQQTKTVPWDAAQNIVMQAYADFAPEMADIAKPFFTKGWIDAAVKPGQGPRGLCPSDGGHGPPLCDAKLHGQAARCDDTGP